MIMNACRPKGSTSEVYAAHLAVHANWDILFKLHYEFHTELFMNSSEAGQGVLCREYMPVICNVTR